MTEATLQLLAVYKILIASMCALLYGFGGMGGTAIRRYLMPVMLAVNICILTYILGSFSVWYLLYPVLLCAALHLPYGANTFKKKVCLRTIFGLAVAFSAIIIPIVSGRWGLFLFHVPFVVLSNIIFGVFNPFSSARDEESALGFFDTIIPIFMV